MTHVKIKIRPDQLVTFPTICVHCNQPAPQLMRIQKRISRTIRLIDVPICADCHRILQTKSVEEEQLSRLQWLVAGFALLVTWTAVLIALPPELQFGGRALLSLLVAAGATAVVLALFRYKMRAAITPEKQALRQAARIETFSWRATTFAFENEQFKQQFAQINEPLVMEI